MCTHFHRTLVYWSRCQLVAVLPLHFRADFSISCLADVFADLSRQQVSLGFCLPWRHMQPESQISPNSPFFPSALSRFFFSTPWCFESEIKPLRDSPRSHKFPSSLLCGGFGGNFWPDGKPGWGSAGSCWSLYLQVCRRHAQPLPVTPRFFPHFLPLQTGP